MLIFPFKYFQMNSFTLLNRLLNVLIVVHDENSHSSDHQLLGTFYMI